MKLSLSIKQTIYVFIASMLCGGLSAAVHVYLNLEKDRVVQAEIIARSVDLHRDTLSSAVYTLDEEQTEEILMSLIRQPLIKRAAFYDDFGDALGDKQRAETYAMSPYIQAASYLVNMPPEQSFQISVSSRKQNATLTIYVDESVLANELVKEVQINLGIALIFTLLLAAILVLLNYVYISKPVMKIGLWVTNLSSGKSMEPLPYIRDDELGLLVERFSNEWQANQAASVKLTEMVDSLATSERFSRLLMENSSEAMFLCHPNTQVQFVNKLAEELLGLSFDTLNGRSLAEFSQLFSVAEMEVLFKKIAAHSVHSYDDEFVSMVGGNDEKVHLECRATYFDVDGNAFVMVNARDVTERVIAQKKIHELAYYDSLTQLANRSLFSQQIEELIQQHHEESKYGALLYFDLDQFKKINDSLGHGVGDQVLIEVASRTRSIFKAKAICGRLGGDEFVVALSDLADSPEYAAEKAMVLARELANSLSKPLILDDATLHTTASIGIAFFPDENVDASELIRRADTAMYKAKSLGRNGVQFFEREMQYAAQHLLELEEGIHIALEKNQFEIWVQPQVSIGKSRLRGEVLVRWNSPKHGLVMPGFFIPHAEESGLIIDIDKWVLEESMSHLATWRQIGKLDQIERLSVNVSPSFFLQVDFVTYITNLLDKYEIPGNLIVLEITENLLLNNFEVAKNKMLQLKTKGIAFSIDDFGTGYSSLRYLKELPLDELKIDRSFVNGLTDGTDTSPLIDVILTMAKRLDLEVIAEGVETQTQLDLLVSQGCVNFQGYYFGHPVVSDKFVGNSVPLPIQVRS
ncbi:EAL domain-containing protein [Vibrio sp. SCSIO 43136]|uniref:sensor domain-containing protein n=1 Tax=Vibrio sp. SCSIO 43136 TaxID=2819101 RepID=UPI0020753BF6|nr:EAL domain-containing protein [Vibrio sp. SCSIO 43136]USD67330.1 EAL domain-containing protein [Vibrio sp. SCSIO 43136]